MGGDPAPSPQRGWSPSLIFGSFLLWPNGWMHQDATWYGSRPPSTGLCVRWGPSALSQKGWSPTQFSAHVYCGQMAGWIKMTLGMEVGLGPVHIVLDGNSAHLPKKGAEPPIFGSSLLWPNGWMHQNATWYGGRPQPRRLCVRCGPSTLSQKGWSPTQFSAHVYCGQMAAWIKMPLGTEVGLGLCDIVFYVNPATRIKKSTPPHPIFGPCLLWQNGWMDEDAACYGSRHWPRPHCTRWGPSSREMGTAAHCFRPMSIVAMVVHLNYC